MCFQETELRERSPGFLTEQHALCSGWDTGTCKAGKGWEHTTEGVTFHPKKVNQIQEGDGGEPETFQQGKGYELHFRNS